jgi:hypothetical protein
LNDSQLVLDERGDDGVGAVPGDPCHVRPFTVFRTDGVSSPTSTPVQRLTNRRGLEIDFDANDSGSHLTAHPLQRSPTIARALAEIRSDEGVDEAVDARNSGRAHGSRHTF